MEAKKMKYDSDNCKTWGDLVALSHEGDLQKMMRNAYERAGITHKYDEKAPLADISVKDELCLMDIATFSLTKQPDLENLVIQYDLKDAQVTISGIPNRGVATVYDYDIVLYMVSHLAKEMNKVKKIIQDAEAHNKRNPKNKISANPELPARYFEPDIDTLLEFCGRPRGGMQYERVHQALHRLLGTTVSIERTQKDGKRRGGGFSYISDFEIIGRKEDGTVHKVRIGIPNWIYDGIVRIENPTLLSMNREYFNLSEGIHRFLHRYARKVAGFGAPVKVSLKDLHARSGSKQSYKYFNRDLKKSLEKLQNNPLSDYSITYQSEGRGKNFVVFQKLKSNTVEVESVQTCPIELTEELLQRAQSIAPNYDPKRLFKMWVEWTNKKIGWNKVTNAERAFLAFCETNYKRNPNP